VARLSGPCQLLCLHIQSSGCTTAVMPHPEKWRRRPGDEEDWGPPPTWQSVLSFFCKGVIEGVMLSLFLWLLILVLCSTSMEGKVSPCVCAWTDYETMGPWAWKFERPPPPHPRAPAIFVGALAKHYLNVMTFFFNSTSTKFTCTRWIYSAQTHTVKCYMMLYDVICLRGSIQTDQGWITT